MNEKDFGRLFAEFVTQQIGTKETDSIEEQYLNNLTKNCSDNRQNGNKPTRRIYTRKTNSSS